MRDRAGIFQLDAQTARLARADGRGAAMDQHGRTQRLAEIPDRVEMLVRRRKCLHRRLILHPAQAEIANGVLDLRQPRLAAPGIDHRPARQKDVRVGLVQAREFLIGEHAVPGAGRAVPGDGHRHAIVAAAIGDDLLHRAGGEFAFEHPHRRRQEAGRGVGIGLGLRMNVNVDGAHQMSPSVFLMNSAQDCRIGAGSAPRRISTRRVAWSSSGHASSSTGGCST